MQKRLVGLGNDCEVVGFDADDSVNVLDESAMGMTLAHDDPSSNGSNSVRYRTKVIQFPNLSLALS